MDFEVKEIGILTICGECNNMYSGMPGGGSHASLRTQGQSDYLHSIMHPWRI